MVSWQNSYRTYTQTTNLDTNNVETRSKSTRTAKSRKKTRVHSIRVIYATERRRGLSSEAEKDDFGNEVIVFE